MRYDWEAALWFNESRTGNHFLLRTIIHWFANLLNSGWNYSGFNCTDMSRCHSKYPWSRLYGRILDGGRWSSPTTSGEKLRKVVCVIQGKVITRIWPCSFRQRTRERTGARVIAALYVHYQRLPSAVKDRRVSGWTYEGKWVPDKHSNYGDKSGWVYSITDVFWGEPGTVENERRWGRL